MGHESVHCPLEILDCSQAKKSCNLDLSVSFKLLIFIKYYVYRANELGEVVLLTRAPTLNGELPSLHIRVKIDILQFILNLTNSMLRPCSDELVSTKQVLSMHRADCCKV